jgi:hypothetical protein
VHRLSFTSPNPHDWPLSDIGYPAAAHFRAGASLQESSDMMRHRVGGGLSRPRAAITRHARSSGGSWLRARAVACNGCWKTTGSAATLARRKQVTSQCLFVLRAVCVQRGHAATAQAPARRKVQVHGHVYGYKEPRSPELSEEHIWPCTCAFRRADACAVSACPVRNTMRLRGREHL